MAPPPDAHFPRDVLGFLAFSHGWTWAFWAVASLQGTTVWERPAVYFFLLGGAGVMIGGLVMNRIRFGPGGFRDMGRRMIDPRRATGRWWMVALLFFPVLTALAAGLVVLRDGSAPPVDVQAAVARLADPASLLAMMGLILVIGPLPEEVGWRGYLQDRLQERWTALAATLTVAIAWWSWHLPLFLVPGFFEVFDIATPTPLGFLAGILPAAVLYAWLYNNTRRSVLAVIVFHFMQNFSGEILALSEGARIAQVVLMAVAAVFVLWWWGPRTLRGRPRQP